MGTIVEPPDPSDSDALADGRIDAEDVRRDSPPEDDGTGLDSERPVVLDERHGDVPDEGPDVDASPDPSEM